MKLLPPIAKRAKPLVGLRRRQWLATWLQDRRRRSRLTPRLTANALGVLVWEWHGQNPYRWNIWTSPDGGLTYEHIEDWWAVGSDRDFAPDGGSQFCLVVGVDENGREITRRSNAIRPDDWITLSPLLMDLLGYWDGDSVHDQVAVREMQNADTGQFGSPQARPDGSLGVFEAAIESDCFFSKDAAFDDYSARTVSAWFHLTNWQGMMLLADMADSGSGNCTGLGIRWCPDGWFFEVFSYNGTSWDIETHAFDDEPPGYGSWIMLTLTSDEYEARVYLNGVLTATLYKSAPTQTYGGAGAESFYLNGPHPFGNFTGKMCYVGLWGRVLDGAEIGTLYNAGSGRAFASL